jgi:DNA-directed RNA polymerase omega subunit
MVKIDVDKILGKDESYYSFVLGVAKRAREITDEQLKKVKELSDQDKGKNTVIDRAKQLPEELSMKPVRLAIEDIKAGKCHLEIESATEVLRREEQERIQKLMAQQKGEIYTAPIMTVDDDDEEEESEEDEENEDEE